MMIYASIDKTDVPVEVLEYIAPNKVKVQSIIGRPFGEDRLYDGHGNPRLIARCNQNIAIVKREQIKVVPDG